MFLSLVEVKDSTSPRDKELFIYLCWDKKNEENKKKKRTFHLLVQTEELLDESCSCSWKSNDDDVFLSEFNLADFRMFFDVIDCFQSFRQFVGRDVDVAPTEEVWDVIAVDHVDEFVDVYFIIFVTKVTESCLLHCQFLQFFEGCVFLEEGK